MVASDIGGNEVLGLADDSPSIAYKPAPEGTIRLEEKTESAARPQVIFSLIFIWAQELQPSRGNLPGVVK